MEEMKETQQLLGKQVRVRLGTAGCPGNENPYYVYGKLVAITDDGVSYLEGEDGYLTYCWPRLEVEEWDADFTGNQDGGLPVPS